jgi:dihydrofolate reductase
MSKIIAYIGLTLDGVIQSPGRPDEDTRGGFEHGGWAAPFQDPAIGKAVAASMGNKYVASRTLKEPLPWMNSQLLPGDAEPQVAELRTQPGKDIVILGSGQLVQSLMRCNLIDKLMLTIHPLVLGTGRRLFVDGAPPSTLRLIDSQSTSTGVVMANYEARR